ELKWHVGVFFEGVQGAEKLKKEGAQYLERELLERTDARGIPDSSLLSRFPYWLAALVRTLAAARERDVALWSDEGADQFKSLVQRMAPLCQPDGRFLLSACDPADSRRLMDSALDLSGWAEADSARHSLFVSSPAAARQNGSATSTKRPAERPSAGDI